jgi:hypothetical protein
MARSCAIGAAVILCILTLATAARAQAIGGSVTDTSRGVLPGVTVEVRSPALIEQVRVAVTDGSGQYLVTGLESGDYTVTFTLPGLATLIREGITLNAGFTANIDAELTVGGVEESITVSGAAPVVDIARVQQTQSIDRDLIDAVPSGKSFQNLGILIPGMVGDGVVGSTLAVDVGGQGGVNYQRLSIHGGQGSDQVVQVDGLGVESATRGGDSSNLYFADGNYSEYAIDFAGNSAEVETGGVRINLIPREGGNQWSGQFFTSFSGQNLQSNNVSQDLVDQGIAKSDANRLSKLWMYNPSGGGPIVKDRLWFYASHTQSRTDQFVANVFHDLNPSDLAYTPDLTRQAIDDQLARSNTLRLTFQASARNKFTFFYDNNYNKRNRFLIGSTLSSALNVMPEAAVDSTIKLSVYQGTWTAPLSNRLLFEAGFSLHPQHQNWKNTPDADPSLPGALIIPGNVAIRGMSSWFSGTVLQDRFADTNALRASMSYVTGSHAFKVGFTATMITEDNNTESVSYQRIIALPASLVVDLVNFYATADLEENDVSPNLGIFVQDQWTMNRVTLNLGARFDYFRASYPEHNVPTSLYRPVPATFAAKAVVGYKDIQPRLGISYDLSGDGRTALKASFNRYADRDSNSRAGDINPAGTNISQSRVFIDFNGNGLADCNPLNTAPNGECLTPSDNLAFGLPVINTFYDEDWAFGWGTRHSNYESSISVQHEVADNVSLNVGYFYRSYVNFSTQDNRALGADDFGPFSVTAPTDSRLPGGGGNVLSGFFDLNPDKLGQVDDITTSANDFGGRSQAWNGFDISVNSRLEGVLLQGGISTGRTSNNSCDLIANLPETDALLGPNCSNATPYLTQVKLIGSYSLPYDVVLAGTLQSIHGPERSAIVTFSNADIAGSLGRPLSSGATRDINVLEEGTEYAQRINQLDIRVSKLFDIAEGRVRVSFDIYNLLNENAVTEEDLNFGPNYLRPTALMPGRLGKFAIQFNF